MGTKRVAACAIASMLVIGCAADDETEPATGEDAATEEARAEATAGESDMASLLAAIDNGPNPDAAVVDQYRADLDAATQACEQDREAVGDIAARMYELAGDEGADVTVREMLVALTESIPEEMAPMDCAEIGGAVLSLITS